jgi:hypothetical protein
MKTMKLYVNVNKYCVSLTGNNSTTALLSTNVFEFRQHVSSMELKFILIIRHMRINNVIEMFKQCIMMNFIGRTVHLI